MGKWDNIKESVLDKLFPRKCPLCGTLLLPNERICGKCSDNVVYIYPPICQRCGRPIFDCSCREGEFAFSRCISPFVYTKSIRNGIHRFKFRNVPEAADFFGLFMAAAIQREYGDIHFDIVLGVPMHPSDIRHRGYNQADLLARSVSQRLDVPLGSRVLIKSVHTHAQHTLSRAERRRNVSGVFTVAKSYLVAGRTILLCDDILTTGSTLDACANELLKAGARSVYCVTAAAVVGSQEKNIKKMYV